MKTNKLLYNNMLRMHNKCIRRLSSLMAANRNTRRQGILQKHITRLYERLMNLQASFKQTTIATALVIGAMALQPNEANAQITTFSTGVINPYGIIPPSSNYANYSKPAFADLDNDGDLDMLSGAYYGDFVYYQNTGTNTNPIFTTPNNNPFGLMATPGYYSASAFVDLDQDGDMDMMAADRNGNFNYYANVGTSAVPSFSSSVLNPFGTTQISNYASVAFADIDNDGDMDMMASSSYDTNFYYFENIGTNTSPSFAAVVINPFGLSTGYGYGATLGDLDNDGDIDIMNTTNGRDFYYFQNTGTNLIPAFTTPAYNPFALFNLSNVTNSSNFATTFVDLNNDGKLDLMTGDRKGEFIYNKNTIIPGAVLNFNGTTNYASSPAFSILTNNITLGAYVNWAGPTTGNQVIITNGNTGSAGYAIFVDKSNFDQLSVVLGGVVVMQSTASLQINSWSDIALVCNAGTWNLYIDGATYPLTNNTSVPNPVAGSFVVGGNQAGLENFNGSIDEVKFWGRALCLGEINTYSGNGELPMPQSNLLAYYKFNQGLAFQNNAVVTLLADSSGNANNLTLNNFVLTGSTSNWIAPGVAYPGKVAPVFVSPVINVSGINVIIPAGLTVTLTATGVNTYLWSANTGNATTSSVAVSPTATTIYTVQGISSQGCVSNIASSTVQVGNVSGAAIDFDGVNDYVNMGTGINTAISSLNNITVEVWVNPTNTSGNGEIIGNYANPIGKMQFMIRRDGAQYTFWVGNGNGGSFQNVTSTATVTLGDWQHIAGVWNGSDLKIFVNGMLSGTQTGVTYSNFGTSSNYVSVGGESTGAGEYFKGRIDEARIWTRALNQCEIQKNMNGELKMPQTGLLTYYKFNQGMSSDNNTTITTLADSTANGYNGNLTNFALNGPTSNWVALGAVVSGSYAPLLNLITVTGNTSICAGTTTTLTAVGTANTYTWSSSSMSDTTIVSPTGNTTYTVTGSYLGCAPSSTTVSVSVNSLPTVSASSSNTFICSGQTASLTATGATSYLWNTTSTNSVIAITPTTTTVYTVIGTDANGCSNMATVTQSVSSCTGLQNGIVNSELINLYPNPSNGIYNIDVTTTSIAIVYNALGAVVLNKIIEVGTHQLNLSNQATGIYVAKVISNGKVQTVRLIKE